MNCKIKEEQLSAWLLGHLLADEAEAMKQHVGQCQKCAQTVADLKASMQLLTSKTEPILPLGFQERVVARAKELKPASKIWGWQKGLVALAAACLLGLGLVNLWPHATDNQQFFQSYTEDFNTIGYFSSETATNNETDGMFGIPSELTAYLINN